MSHKPEIIVKILNGIITRLDKYGDMMTCSECKSIVSDEDFQTIYRDPMRKVNPGNVGRPVDQVPGYSANPGKYNDLYKKILSL